MHLSANSDHSPCSPKTKLFHIEFSDIHVSKKDSMKPWRDQFERQLLEAKYLTDEDSVLVPADVAAIVHPSQKETLRVGELRHLRGSRMELGRKRLAGTWLFRPSCGRSLLNT
jgi:hypothetical protein